MVRNQQDIIQDLLAWRNPYSGMDLPQHIETELEKLANKIERRPRFSETYAEHSGELPSTVLAKMKDCTELLKQWKNTPPESIVITEREKTIASDLLEFITMPFYRFSSSASNALSSWGGIASKLIDQPEGNAVQLGQRVDQLVEEHRGLSLLLIELCDSAKYPIPKHIRTACNSGSGPDNRSL